MFRINSKKNENKVKVILFLFMYFINSFLYAENRLNVVIFINDTKMSNLDVRKMSEIIYLLNDYQVDDFSVIHYNHKSNSTEKWTKKKKNITYKSILADCNFDICNKINGYIDATRTEENKFFICQENSIKCNFLASYIQTKTLINNQYTTISDEIKLEQKSNKKLKTLYFYFSGKTIEKNEIKFSEDTLNIDELTNCRITPNYSSNYVSYKWNNNDGLSCYDCKFPSFKGVKSTSYFVTCIDSLGCEIKSKNIQINIHKNCIYGNSASELILREDITPKYVFVNPTGRNDHDWNIAANSAGGLQFDLLATPNCADSYLVELIENGKVVWKQKYEDKSAIDLRAQTDLHKIYPEKYVFRLKLNDLHKKINVPKDDPNLYYFNIKITSYDSKNTKYETYISPKILFSHCSQ